MQTTQAPTPATKSNVLKTLFIVYFIGAGLTILSLTPYIIQIIRERLVGAGLIPPLDQDVTTLDLLGFGLLLLIPICLVTALFGVAVAIVTFVNWRRAARRYKVFGFIALGFSLVCLLIAITPFALNRNQINKLNVAQRTNVEAAYVSYDTARSEVLDCHIASVWAKSFEDTKGNSVKDFFLRLYKTTKPSSYNDSAPTSIDTIYDEDPNKSIPLEFKYADQIIADVEEANASCPDKTSYWPGALRSVTDASESQRQPL